MLQRIGTDNQRDLRYNFLKGMDAEMDNRQKNVKMNNERPYVRNNTVAGINPLCDKLRAQYGPRFDVAINRSIVRREELIREAKRNGWSRVRRPAPSYKVKNPLRTYEPTPMVDRDVKIYDPSAAKIGRDLAMASVGADAKSGRPNASNNPEMRRGVNAMSHNSAVEVPRRSVFSSVETIVFGKNLGRSDEKQVKKSEFPIGIIFAVVICALLFMLVVYCSMQKAVIEDEISALEAEVSALANTEKQLTVQLEMRDDLREIERYAVETIGMVKKENVQTKYITTIVDEKSVVLDSAADEDDEIGGASAILSIFGNKLSEFVEYIN